MSTFKVGIIGCGRRRGHPKATGAGMAHHHVAGYKTSPDVDVVAAADICKGNLDAFTEEYEIPRGYLSAEAMFANESLDIVSICLWPHLHAPMTIRAAQAGVKGVHCEKPMATSFGEARRMVEACERNDVVLTFNHMRRFGAPFRKAKALLDAGAIGELTRLEAFTSNLYDWGTHWFDMLFFYNDDIPVDWVVGQIDARGSHRIFGAMVEGQGLSLFKYRNGVMGLMVTGARGFYEQDEPLRSVHCENRLIGTTGTLEVGASGGPDLRMRNAETGGHWEAIEVEGGMHGSDLHTLAILDLIDALKEGREPELAARKALQTTALIFGTYESSRRRARVDLPLDIEDSPFRTMLDRGDVAQWTEGEIEANGIKLHYVRTGDRTKPTLILSHGFTDNGLCWAPVARELESDYDVIMYDARGHGLSDAPESGYTTEDRADDLAGLVMALDLEKPSVLGHSMGGSTAAAAGAKYPDLFGKLLLEDPGWWEPDSERVEMSDEERLAWVERRRAEMVARKQMSKAALMALCRENSPTWSEAEVGPWAIAKQQLSPNIVNVVGGKPRSWREDVKRLESPTLMIIADNEKGGIVTPEMAEEAQALNDLVEVVKIEAGHSVRREAFDIYMEAVRDFLAS